MLENLNAVQIGHADIEQNEIGRLVLSHAQAGLAGNGFRDLVSPLFALLAQRPAHQALVVNDQNLLRRHACLAYYGREGNGRSAV